LEALLKRAPHLRVLEQEIVYPQLFAVRKPLSLLVSTN
jgi:hypothetical protein